MSAQLNNPVIATLKIELNQDRSFMVVGCLQNKALALELLDAAREQVIAYHKRNGIIVPK